MDIPRRIRVDLMTPAELAIRSAVLAVEEIGCDVRLTEAVVLLQAAKEKVADYVDGVGLSAPRKEVSCDCQSRPHHPQCINRRCSQSIASTADWDRDTGNGFNERGYDAGQGIYHDPMG